MSRTIKGMKIFQNRPELTEEDSNALHQNLLETGGGEGLDNSPPDDDQTLVMWLRSQSV